MHYSTQQRNEAIQLIAQGKADFEKNADLYEQMETFDWLKLQRVDGVIKKAELAYTALNLNFRLNKVRTKI